MVLHWDVATGVSALIVGMDVCVVPWLGGQWRANVGRTMVLRPTMEEGQRWCTEEIERQGKAP